MNEQIQKFMQECFDISIDGRGREECTADYINVEKFAKLVALECARVVKASSLNGMMGVNAIRIHFGLEP
jgi:hypothetical protein